MTWVFHGLFYAALVHSLVAVRPPFELQWITQAKK